MKSFVFAAAVSLAALSSAAQAAPTKYTLDASHSQVVFSYQHLGFSTTYGMFSGFEGEIMFDAEEPANSSVTVSMPVTSMFTGWEARTAHFMGDQFFGATDEDLITFASTGIEVTGEGTALITGDLTMNDVTKPVVLDAKLNASAVHPMSGAPYAGFDAVTSVNRSDFGLGAFAPAVGDEVEIMISIEAQQAE
ncbi:polyisoprenoid-binding protein [Alphaproteobacteria bacterium KMM 3653]|uniref:Polyisoprenoid-binding protein n=1 Tax=Harenicola maris TaxID=2841044 RepID=A0AAP2CMG2_9RHOB|nr:polyisoprenoid-binding protein [Harenicola maris]